MEKIQAVPMQMTERAQKEPVQVNEKEFARQFQLFSHVKDEESSKKEFQLLDDSRPADSAERKEELESDDQVFTLINPLLHIQAESDELKTVALSESNFAIEAEGHSVASTLEKTVVEFVQSDKQAEPTGFQHLNNSEAVVMSEQSPDLEIQHLNEALVEPTEQVTNKEKASFQPLDTVDVKEPTRLIKDKEQAALPLNRSVQSNETTQSIEAIDQKVTSVTVEEMDRTLKSVNLEINSETENKHSIISDEEETIPNIFSTTGSKQTSVEETQPVQPTPSQTIPVVTKEEGMEMIKEMVTETLVDDNGVETVRSTIKLTPESLGEVEIELVSTDKGLTGKIVFQSEEAKQWMEKEWEQFKIPLETKGVSFQTLELTVSQPIQNHTVQSQLGKFSFSENFSQSQQDQEARQQANKGERILGNEDIDNSLETGEAPHLNGLNVYV